MEIKIELDIQSIVANAVSAERIQPIVDKAICDAVRDAIQSATGYNSEFRKSLGAQIAAAMPHGLAIDDVAKFQHILNQSINKLVLECNENTVKTAIDKAVSEVMPDIPAVVKLSDLLDMARPGFHKEPHEGFYAFYEESSYGGGWLYLDKSENPGSSLYSSLTSSEGKKYSASIRLGFNKSGEVYALRLDGKDVTPAGRPAVIGEFHATLMALYVGRSKLEIDMDADDVESAAQEQYD